MQYARYKRNVKGGIEDDVFTKWRKVLKYTHRSRICKKVKQQFNQRERRQNRQSIQGEESEAD